MRAHTTVKEDFMQIWKVALSYLWFIGVIAASNLYGQQHFSAVRLSTNPVLASLSLPISAIASTTLPTGCGTDSSGNPTNNLSCGANGSSPYVGEGAATNLTGWCGGSVPGRCHAITSCDEELTEGSWESHTKYYLPSDLNCGPASSAIILTRYVDINLNNHKVTGLVYSNAGPKGWHVFGGEINCTLSGYPTKFLVRGVTHYTYACLQAANNSGSYIQGGGDQIKLHHVYGHNGMACAKYVQFDGNLPAPAGGWTEAAIDVYNMTFQSVPVGTSCPREYAGVYSETTPVEFHHIRGDVGGTGPANATQMLVVYGKGTNGAYPNYIHNNYLTCEPASLPTGDSCRAILLDGAMHNHVQYNDIWASNNRGTRLRDAFYTEVDHNYYHGISVVNGYTGMAIHTGDNDVNSGQGQVVPQTIHHNTFELAGGWGLFYRAQQGLVVESNRFTCFSGGCDGSLLMRVENGAGGFSYPAGVIASANTVTQASGSFVLGTAIKTGSVISFEGFAHAGNNQIFTVSSSTSKALTLSDPNNLLVSETSSSAKHIGVTHAYLYNSSIGAGLTPKVQVNYGLTRPTAFLTYCNSGSLTKVGNGVLQLVTGTCP